MNTTFSVSSNTWQKLRAKAPYLTPKLKVQCQTNPPPEKWHMECPAGNSRKFRWLKIQKRRRTPSKIRTPKCLIFIATPVWHNISFTARRFNPMKCNLIWISRTSKDSLILWKHTHIRPDETERYKRKGVWKRGARNCTLPRLLELLATLTV